MISYTNIFPPYWGGATRIYNLTKILASENKIWLLCNDYHFLRTADSNCKEFKELSSHPNVKLIFSKFLAPSTQIINPMVIVEGLKIIKNERTDFMIANSLYSAFNTMFLSFITGVPFILDEHNVEFLRHEKMYKDRWLHRKILKIYEKLACKFSLKIFCVSETDRNLLVSKIGIKENKIIVIPNGVDTKKFYPNEKKAIELRKRLDLNEKPLILFFGKLDYKPNYEAIKIIRSEILPRVLKKIPEAKFVIVGDKPPLECNHENILFTGLVENIEDFINLSDIVICPLLSGGGTRLKILEALCCGKIVISTTIGAEGIMLNEFKDSLLISDDWNTFSDKIVLSLSTKNASKIGDFYSLSWRKSADEIKKVI